MAKIKPAEAANVIVKLVLEAGIPGLRKDVARDLPERAPLDAEGMMTTYVTYGDFNIFGYEVGLSFNVVHGKVEVNWGSMNRSPSNARANIALMAKVTDLACLIEAYLSNVEITRPF